MVRVDIPEAFEELFHCVGFGEPGFCMYCGGDLEDYTCTRCGTHWRSVTANYCPDCGRGTLYLWRSASPIAGPRGGVVEADGIAFCDGCYHFSLYYWSENTGDPKLTLVARNRQVSFAAKGILVADREPPEFDEPDED